MNVTSSLLLLTTSIPLRNAYAALLRCECAYPVVTLEKNLEHAAQVIEVLQQDQIDVILMETSLTTVRRSELSGIRLAQKLRRDQCFAGTFLFTGFQPRQFLAGRVSFLAEGVPGVQYLQLPGEVSQLCAVLNQCRRITESELRNTILTHCGVREEARQYIHEITTFLTYATGIQEAPAIFERNRAGAAHQAAERLLWLLQQLQMDPETIIISGLLQAIPHLPNREQVIALLHSLSSVDRALQQTTLLPASLENIVEKTWPAHPPEGYETIFIADDDGYPRASAAYLTFLGYGVTVETEYQSAWQTLSADPSAVLVCDQTFDGDSRAGTRLMARARERDWPLIIALSGSSVDPDMLQEAHRVCAGPLAKMEEGARQIHAIIWEWATRT